MAIRKDMYDHEGWAQVARAAGLEPVDVESQARLALKVAAEILEVLKLAEQHLSYCGYGDSWERSCADHDKLPERISEVIEKYSPVKN